MHTTPLLHIYSHTWCMRIIYVICYIFTPYIYACNTCCIHTEEADLDAELACLEDELEGEGLEVDAQPAYLKPSTLPVQPSVTPVTAPPVSSGDKVGSKGEVDEYGLPLHA